MIEPIQAPANDRNMYCDVPACSYPRLLADIGGTHIRFAVEVSAGRLEAVSLFLQKSFVSIADAFRAYLSKPQAIAAGVKTIRYAAIAIANPIGGDWITMTNADRSFSIESLRQTFGFDRLLVVNDFTALARAIPLLRQGDYRQIGGGCSEKDTMIGVIGAGTGLGVSGLLPVADQWIALESEGGHVSFSPFNDKEVDILRFAWAQYPHVSAERLLSGEGLELIYRALLALGGRTPDAKSAPEISHGALALGCAVCDEAIEIFCQMLGTASANLALSLGARGGIYLGGGIVSKWGDRFDRSGFRERFESKGRFSEYLSKIPTVVITADNPTFIGASEILSSALLSDGFSRA